MDKETEIQTLATAVKIAASVAARQQTKECYWGAEAVLLALKEELDEAQTDACDLCRVR